MKLNSKINYNITTAFAVTYYHQGRKIVTTCGHLKSKNGVPIFIQCMMTKSNLHAWDPTKMNHHPAFKMNFGRT